ncbi:hypothetical protein AQUCO_01500197v1 [Aquilegia coerulea]|uniref:Myb/SANT-like domain-containing protein n=1 Tax=Aquilegia coerulea TaxID=218851 RepID=A0A2G5DSJ1_AQUCA|nr:hypothetical protein AQUCO_01500197v1 [Aquilegia coerulea]
MANTPARKQIRWTDEMDSILIRVLFDEAVSGNRKSDNGWKPEALKHLVEAVVQLFGAGLQPKHVRSRLKTMKKEYQAVKEALDKSGFTFNNETHLIGGDDVVWEDYLRAYPKAAFLRYKMLLYYDEMVVIFGKDIANGSNHFEPMDEMDGGMDETQSPTHTNASLIG